MDWGVFDGVFDGPIMRLQYKELQSLLKKYEVEKIASSLIGVPFFSFLGL